MAYELVIVTPEGECFREQVVSVKLPGTEGELAALAGHEAYLVPLDIGELQIELDNRFLYAAISGGFAEIRQERVVVLVDACELAENIDLARAERAQAKAEEALQQAKEHEPDRSLLVWNSAIRRAHTRIEVSKRN